MATPAQLSQYCTDHGFKLTQGTHHMDFASINWTIVGLVVAAFVGFEIGHYGLQAIYNWIKTKVSNVQTKVTSTPNTPTVPSTVVTTA